MSLLKVPVVREAQASQNPDEVMHSNRGTERIIFILVKAKLDMFELLRFKVQE